MTFSVIRELLLQATYKNKGTYRKTMPNLMQCISKHRDYTMTGTADFCENQTNKIRLVIEQPGYTHLTVTVDATETTAGLIITAKARSANRIVSLPVDEQMLSRNNFASILRACEREIKAVLKEEIPVGTLYILSLP